MVQNVLFLGGQRPSRFLPRRAPTEMFVTQQLGNSRLLRATNLCCQLVTQLSASLRNSRFSKRLRFSAVQQQPCECRYLRLVRIRIGVLYDLNLGGLHILLTGSRALPTRISGGAANGWQRKPAH